MKITNKRAGSGAQILIRVPSTVKAELSRQAALQNRSLSAQVRFILTRALATKALEELKEKGRV